jgi:hypothetical protein
MEGAIPAEDEVLLSAAEFAYNVLDGDRKLIEALAETDLNALSPKDFGQVMRGLLFVAGQAERKLETDRAARKEFGVEAELDWTVPAENVRAVMLAKPKGPARTGAQLRDSIASGLNMEDEPAYKAMVARQRAEKEMRDKLERARIKSGL